MPSAYPKYEFHCAIDFNDPPTYIRRTAGAYQTKHKGFEECQRAKYCRLMSEIPEYKMNAMNEAIEALHMNTTKFKYHTTQGTTQKGGLH